MLKRLLLIVFLCATTCSSAADIRVSWQANIDTVTDGYKIYYGMKSRQYTNTVDVSSDTINVLSGFQVDSTYYFAVTAYSLTKESVFSDEVVFKIESKEDPAPDKVLGVEIRVSEDGQFTITIIKEE